MTVTEQEIKCYEYINAVRDVESLPPGLYRADAERERIHNELCELFGLSKEQTKKYTTDLDKIDYNGTELYFLLLKLKRNKHGKQKTK